MTNMAIIVNNVTLALKNGGEIHIDEKFYLPRVPVPLETFEIETYSAIDSDLDNWYCYHQPEATQVRVYWFEAAKQWIISTSHRIDAYTSYWGSGMSFGAIFDSFVQDVYEETDLTRRLDKNFCYHFFLETTSKNRIVEKRESDSGKDRFVYFGRMPVFTERMIYATDEPTILPELKRVVTGREIGPVALVMSHRSSFTTVKIWNAAYHEKMMLRGNDAFVDRRYILYKLTDLAKAKEYLELYDEKKAMLEKRYADFMQLCCHVFNDDRYYSNLLQVVRQRNFLYVPDNINELGRALLMHVNYNILKTYF